MLFLDKTEAIPLRPATHELFLTLCFDDTRRYKTSKTGMEKVPEYICELLWNYATMQDWQAIGGGVLGPLSAHCEATTGRVLM